MQNQERERLKNKTMCINGNKKRIQEKNRKAVKEFDLTKATLVSRWIQAFLVLSQAKITNSLSSVTSSFYIKSFMSLLNLHYLQALNNFTVA